MIIRVLEKAEAHEPAIARFLRDLIALPSESCHEEDVIRRIKQEMEAVGFAHSGGKHAALGAAKAPARVGLPRPLHQGRRPESHLLSGVYKGFRDLRQLGLSYADRGTLIAERLRHLRT